MYIQKLRGLRASLALALLALPMIAPLAQELPEGATVAEIQIPGIHRPLFLVQFDAERIGRTIKYFVLLPENYQDSGDYYPVLYLLHGFSQNYTAWPTMGVPTYTDTLDLIVVMPDAGNSWYVNWAENGDGQKNDWEDYMVHDVIPHVDATFRTISNQAGRAINGLSMGGYGAIMLGLRHPELFCSIGTHSGALSYARNARTRLENGVEPTMQRRSTEGDSTGEGVSDMIGIPGFTSQSERYPVGIAFKTVEDCDKYDPFKLIFETPPQGLPHIYIDCGMQDGLIDDSREFMMILMANGIPFTFSQSQGEHRPSYWRREVGMSIAVQYTVIERALARIGL